MLLSILPRATCRQPSLRRQHLLRHARGLWISVSIAACSKLDLTFCTIQIFWVSKIVSRTVWVSHVLESLGAVASGDSSVIAEWPEALVMIGEAVIDCFLNEAFPALQDSRSCLLCRCVCSTKQQKHAEPLCPQSRKPKAALFSSLAIQS